MGRVALLASLGCAPGCVYTRAETQTREVDAITITHVDPDHLGVVDGAVDVRIHLVGEAGSNTTKVVHNARVVREGELVRVTSATHPERTESFKATAVTAIDLETLEVSRTTSSTRSTRAAPLIVGSIVMVVVTGLLAAIAVTQMVPRDWGTSE